MPRPPKPGYYDRIATVSDGDEPALLAGHRFDGRPCRACDVPLRAGDPIEFVADGITHSRGRDFDWQSLVVVHAACVGPDDVTMLPVPVALPPRPKRGRPTP